MNVETGRIIITHTVTEDDVVVGVETEGDLALVTHLGMLRMAEDTLLATNNLTDDEP